jgi:hypothetical protein
VNSEEIDAGLAMFNQLEQRSSTKRTRTSTMVHIAPTFTPLPGRLIQVGVALYLLPALVAVLAVSAVGIGVVWAREIVCGSIGRESCVPRDRVGQEIFRA